MKRNNLLISIQKQKLKQVISQLTNNKRQIKKNPFICHNYTIRNDGEEMKKN